MESGEKFNDENPRLVLSTIHKAKGGEADNVALLLESTKACCTLSEPDAERRVFYVGATRAKQKLFVVDNPEEETLVEISAMKEKRAVIFRTKTTLIGNYNQKRYPRRISAR